MEANADGNLNAGVNKRRKVGAYLRKRKDGSTKLCKLKETATVKSMKLYLMKQDIMHDGKSRFHDKMRKGKMQASMKAAGICLKREREAVATQLESLMEG